MKTDEYKLVRACLKNDRRAQKALYERYKHAMFVICLRYASNRLEAEDFLQEGFIKVFSDLDKYDPAKGKLYTWMRTVISRVALGILRKKNVLQFSEDPVDHASKLSYQPDVESDLGLQELTKLIQALPDGYRVVFNLYAIEGYTHNEIAEMLDISEGTSKSQFHRARKELARKIEELKEKAA